MDRLTNWFDFDRRRRRLRFACLPGTFLVGERAASLPPGPPRWLYLVIERARGDGNRQFSITQVTRHIFVHPQPKTLSQSVSLSLCLGSSFIKSHETLIRTVAEGVIRPRTFLKF